MAFTAGGACGHVHGAPCLQALLKAVWFYCFVGFVVVVVNKCLLSSLCYLTFTFGCLVPSGVPVTTYLLGPSRRPAVFPASVVHRAHVPGQRLPLSTQLPAASGFSGDREYTVRPLLRSWPSSLSPRGYWWQTRGRGEVGGLFHSDPDGGQVPTIVKNNLLTIGHFHFSDFITKLNSRQKVNFCHHYCAGLVGGIPIQDS